MKTLKAALDQLLNVLITITVLFFLLKAFDYKLSKSVTNNNNYYLIEDKEKMAALIKNSNHMDIVQYAIDTDDKETKNYIIHSLLNRATMLEEEEVKALITELTLEIFEDKE